MPKIELDLSSELTTTYDLRDPDNNVTVKYVGMGSDVSNTFEIKADGMYVSAKPGPDGQGGTGYDDYYTNEGLRLGYESPYSDTRAPLKLSAMHYVHRMFDAVISSNEVIPSRYQTIEYIQAIYGQAFTLAQTYDDDIKMYFDVDLYGAKELFPDDLLPPSLNPDDVVFTSLFGADENNTDTRILLQIGQYSAYFVSWRDFPTRLLYANHVSIVTGHDMWEDVASTIGKSSNRRIIKVDTDHCRGVFKDDEEYIDDDTFKSDYFDLLENRPQPGPYPNGTLPLGIFAVNNGNGQFSQFTGGKLYGLKVYKGNRLLQWLIPCEDTQTHEVGMWDPITYRFYPSETNEAFIAGNAITYTPPQELIDAMSGTLTPTNFRPEIDFVLAGDMCRIDQGNGTWKHYLVTGTSPSGTSTIITSYEELGVW